jgi:hypothetical protein
MKFTPILIVEMLAIARAKTLRKCDDCATTYPTLDRFSEEGVNH